MQNHFNRPLSQSTVLHSQSVAIVKWRMRLTVKFTMTNGSGHRSNWAGEAIIIKRSQIEHVHAYAREHCSLRDFLIVHLPMEIGLRNSEIRTLRIENIDFESRSFDVLDSKKLELFPLPLDMLSLQLIKDLIEERSEGYVFVHQGSWTSVKHGEPLSHVKIWKITHDIAVEAGVEGYNPRMGRHYFAAHWIFDLKGNLVVLQRILRHKNLTVTTIYVSKLSFFEDIQKAYEGIQNSPLVPEAAQAIFQPKIDDPQRPPSAWVAGKTICDGCLNVEFCKFAGSLPSHATGCRFKRKVEVEQK